MRKRSARQHLKRKQTAPTKMIDDSELSHDVLTGKHIPDGFSRWVAPKEGMGLTLDDQIRAVQNALDLALRRHRSKLSEMLIVLADAKEIAIEEYKPRALMGGDVTPASAFMYCAGLLDAIKALKYLQRNEAAIKEAVAEKKQGRLAA
jgi:hypothetical protein